MTSPMQALGCRFIAVLSLLAVLSGCGSNEPHARNVSPSQSLEPELAAARATYAPEALAYLEAALDTLEANHILGPEHDWEEFRLVVLERGQGAQTDAETHDAIRFGLSDLGERHGGFIPPAALDQHENSASRDVASESESRPAYESPQPTLDLLDRLAHLQIPYFLDPTNELGAAYAGRLQRFIAEADRAGVCGWILDVRGNGGGNMWAMLAGLGPFLGEGRIGAFRLPTGEESIWFYRSGEVGVDDEVYLSLEQESYKLNEAGAPVAVLTDEGTGSSGEAVVIAFIGRPNTRSFGTPTGGAATVPGYYELSDGSWLIFSTAVMADRAGNAYSDRIEPSEITDGPMAAARTWLEHHEYCTIGG